ncbi:MAG TPA: aminoglycoside phosphotransferase family protein [Mycobacteriales bacterium]
MPDLSTYVGIVATAWDGSFGRDAVRLHAGRDHDVVLVGTAAAFRFPRHERAREALPREVAALAQLRDPGVLLPEVFLDRSDAPLGRAFVGQRFLDGDHLDPAAVDAVGAMAYRFADEIARVLDALAEVPIDGDLATTLANAPLRATFPDLAGAIRDDLFDRLSPAGRSRAAGELDAAVAAAASAPATELVHGDFTGANLLWDADETRLTGVLDWAQVHVGDPAYDLASLATTYGWDLVATIEAASVRHDGTRLDRARAYAATFALQTAYGARTACDEEVTAAALRGYA